MGHRESFLEFLRVLQEDLERFLKEGNERPAVSVRVVDYMTDFYAMVLFIAVHMRDDLDQQAREYVPEPLAQFVIERMVAEMAHVFGMPWAGAISPVLRTTLKYAQGVRHAGGGPEHFWNLMHGSIFAYLTAMVLPPDKVPVEKRLAVENIAWMLADAIYRSRVLYFGKGHQDIEQAFYRDLEKALKSGDFRDLQNLLERVHRIMMDFAGKIFGNFGLKGPFSLS